MKNISLIMMDWLKFSKVLKVQYKHLLVGAVSLILLFSCASPEPKIIKNQNTGGALGTSYRLIYLADEELNFQKEIDSVFNVVNRSLSTYIPDSDISKINLGDSTLVVDQMFQEVFRLSKEINLKTKGYFDPTVGTLVDAWGFGPGKQIQLDSSSVDSLMNYVGFDKVRITDKNTINKQYEAIKFDFNAIAKGYAIDRLAVLMDQKGIHNYLLEVGGELVAKGENISSKRPWGVAIQDPEAEGARTSIHLKDRAMASSGNYRKFRIDSITGKRYVHTINPITGFTKNGTTLGVNILAPTCAKADAYATAFMAMDLDLVLKLLEEESELDAYIIYSDESDQTQEFMTDGFKKVVIP